MSHKQHVNWAIYFDVEDAKYIQQVAHERDVNRCDIIRAAIKMWIIKDKDSDLEWSNSTRKL